MSKTILLIEDDNAIIRLMRLSLQTNAYEVTKQNVIFNVIDDGGGIKNKNKETAGNALFLNSFPNIINAA